MLSQATAQHPRRSRFLYNRLVNKKLMVASLVSPSFLLSFFGYGVLELNTVACVLAQALSVHPYSVR